MICAALWLAQCPCSGGEGATNPFLVLAVVAATGWLGSMLVSARKKRGAISMGKSGRIAIVVVVAVVVVAVIVLKQARRTSPSSGPRGGEVANPPAAGTEVSPTKEPKTGIPRLVDLGAGQCIPCKLMAPILEELSKEYQGRLEVTFIDVWKDRAAGARYGIRVIPTQIFFDASGKELSRHEGFMSKEDILAKWKELGIDLEQGATDAGAK